MPIHRLALLCWLSFVGCRAAEPELLDEGPHAGRSGEPPSQASSGGRRGESGPSGEPSAEPDTPSEAGAAGNGPEGIDAGIAVTPACAAPLARVEELSSAALRAGARIALEGLVAISRKFLVYRSRDEGTCLWGVYAAEAGPDGHRGVLLVAYGALAPDGDAACPLGSDAIPDGIEPAVSLSATGVVVSFAPSACDGVVPSIQLRLEPRCPLVVTGTAAEVAPLELDTASADAVAAGDPRALAAWAGALVELQGVSARPVPGESDAVAPYGVIQLEQTALTIHDALAFTDVRGDGPGDPRKAWRFGYPTEFARVRGIVHLDYCTWALAPRDECADFVPASAGCSAAE